MNVFYETLNFVFVATLIEIDVMFSVLLWFKFAKTSTLARGMWEKGIRPGS